MGVEIILALARPETSSSGTVVPTVKFVEVVVVWAEAVRPEANARPSRPSLIGLRKAADEWRAILFMFIRVSFICCFPLATVNYAFIVTFHCGTNNRGKARLYDR